MNEQTNEHEVEAQNRREQRESLDQARRELIASLAQAGKSLVAIPVNMLPEEPRQHVIAAGRELSRGAAALARDLADNLDRFADESR